MNVRITKGIWKEILFISFYEIKTRRNRGLKGFEYKLKYQDIVFEAYSMAYNAIYQNGSNVYVLVPNNDMGNQKVILGSSDIAAEPNVIQEIYWNDYF